MYTLKKSLGQHFLKDENICRKIVNELKQYSFGNLLEIGAGGGALTKYLIQIPDIHFRAVEVDDEKVIFLKNTYPVLKDKIIHKSFLDIDPPFTEPFTIAGNFPYNISSQILFKILEWEDKVECVIGMFQKEVAQRIAAPHGNKEYGILSVLLQAYYDVEYLFTVGEKVFTPPPKVKSAVIRLKRNKREGADFDHDLFMQIVKTAFNQRRKTLHNALGRMSPTVPLDPAIAGKRAEELSVEDYITLAKITASNLRK